MTIFIYFLCQFKLLSLILTHNSICKGRERGPKVDMVKRYEIISKCNIDCTKIIYREREPLEFALNVGSNYCSLIMLR